MFLFRYHLLNRFVFRLFYVRFVQHDIHIGKIDILPQFGRFKKRERFIDKLPQFLVRQEGKLVMFRDYKTFTRIHMNAFTLLHRNDLKSTEPFDLYQFIRIDTFRHDRYEFSQKALGTILVLTCIFGQQTGQILYRQPVIHGRLILLVYS